MLQKKTKVKIIFYLQIFLKLKAYSWIHLWTCTSLRRIFLKHILQYKINALHEYINNEKKPNKIVMSSVSSESAQITFHQFVKGDNF